MHICHAFSNSDCGGLFVVVIPGVGVVVVVVVDGEEGGVGSEGGGHGLGMFSSWWRSSHMRPLILPTNSLSCSWHATCLPVCVM